MDLSTKSLSRSAIRHRIDGMSVVDRRHADQAICRNLLALSGRLGAGTVFGYLALPDEAAVDWFLAGALENGLDVFLPCSRRGRDLGYRRWRPSVPLERDAEGVWTPRGSDVAEVVWADGILVVPGRAFDWSGGRLGRGSGYYDRLLARRPTDAGTAVGVAYDCQMLERVPCEDHDMAVSVVVTESGCRWMEHTKGIG